MVLLQFNYVPKSMDRVHAETEVRDGSGVAMSPGIATCGPTCRPSVLGSATKRDHLWLNKVASVVAPYTLDGLQ